MRGRPRESASASATSRYQGSDGRWHARITVGRRLDGERDRRHITRKTKRELDAAIRELENARDSGQQPWLVENVTVEAWVEHWLDEILPLAMRWKTRSAYASHMRVRDPVHRVGPPHGPAPGDPRAALPRAPRPGQLHPRCPRRPPDPALLPFRSGSAAADPEGAVGAALVAAHRHLARSRAAPVHPRTALEGAFDAEDPGVEINVAPEQAERLALAEPE